jgi:hypothetical protein
MAKRKTKSDPAREIETHRVTWQGFALEIHFERNWLGSSSSEFETAHLEIETITPERQPLPITETGYRSHFLAAAAIDEAGGSVAYVTAWLDHAARSTEWKVCRETQRQLSLF